ncbi:MAG: hypothetical protein ABIQ39_04485 [Ilumatobacteraceae bacterium]
MSERTTASLLHSAVAAISIPRADVSTSFSFVLHAPLELIGRIGLLAFVHAEAREEAERTIAGLVDRYEAIGEGVPIPSRRFDDIDQAVAHFRSSLAAGEPDEVDAAVTWLTERSTIADIRWLLAEAIVDSTAAAGHAPIGLHLLARVGSGTLSPTLLRGPLRELASHPDWRIRWFDDISNPSEPMPLAVALAAVPALGRPGNGSIRQIMLQAETSGVAAAHVGPALGRQPDVAAARRAVMRVAAWSMIHDDPTQAPYGWSHCLTMPQAVMSLAGNWVAPRTAVAVAATFVAGFRAAHGTILINEPESALADSAAFSDVDEPWTASAIADLATNAALHEDAHIVKYTLACLHAAEDDPAWRSVYLRAAAHLADWWRQHPTTG